MKKIILSLLVVLNHYLLFGQSDSVVTIPATAIGPFCPKKLVAGDRDFAGRGPEIEAGAIITFSRTAVLATVKFRAKELPGGDNSETEGTTAKVLFTAPRGYNIIKVEGGSKAEVKFIAGSGAFKFIPGGLSKLTNIRKALSDTNDGLVAEWEIYGDSEGTDISDDDNCTDDTRIITRLNSLKVTLRRTEASLGIFNIKLNDIEEWLVPSALVRGDREFNGNGPRIKTEVKLRLADNGTKIFADVSFWAQETVHDWSTTEGKWSKLVYEAPYGKKITEILSGPASRTQFISFKAGAQIGDYRSGEYVAGNFFRIFLDRPDVSEKIYAFLDQTNIKPEVLAAHGVRTTDWLAISDLFRVYAGNYMSTAYKLPAVEGTLVKFFYIVGDTGGPDISEDENGKDDTRIYRIEFFPAKVKMEDAG
jgi:hypothetical protein